MQCRIELHERRPEARDVILELVHVGIADRMARFGQHGHGMIEHRFLLGSGDVAIGAGEQRQRDQMMGDDVARFLRKRIGHFR